MALLLVIARVLHFGSCLILAAAFAVCVLVAGPALAGGAAPQALHREFLRLMRICLGLGFLSGLLWFWVAVAGMSGTGLWDSLPWFKLVLTQTAPGQVWLVRSILAVLVAGVLCRRLGTVNLAAGSLLSLAWLASLAWLGHAGAAEGGRRYLSLGNDVLHLAAAGFWPAGLLPMALVLRRLADRQDPSLWSGARFAVRRFSALSLLAVTLLALSGVVQSYFLVGSFRALAGTRYGQVLLLKLLLFSIAVVLGARNLLRHRPVLEKSLLQTEQAAALASIRRNVLIEFFLGSAIILVVAVLGITPPPA